MTPKTDREIIENIVRLLPGQWRYNALKSTERLHLLSRPDGAGIYFHTGYGQDRFEVSGKWPTDRHRYMSGKSWGAIPNYEAEPRIGFNKHRPAHQLSRDIQQRFLKHYLPYFKTAQHLKRERDQVRDTIAIKANLLKRICTLQETYQGYDPDRPHYHLSHDQIRGNVVLDNKSVKLTLENLSYEHACRILYLIKQNE